MNKKRNETIEFLRFVSLTEVFLIHYMNDYIHSESKLNIPIVSGQLGVAYFFMITAYLLVKNTSPDSKGFLKKKAIQLLPKYELILFSVFIASRIMPSLFQTFDTSIMNFVKSIFLIPYRTVGVPFSCPLLPVAWTLGVQVVVYVLFYIMIQLTRSTCRAACTTSGILVIAVLIGKISGNTNLLIFTYGRFYMLYFVVGFLIAILEEKLPLLKSCIKTKECRINTFFCLGGALLFLVYSCVYKENIFYLGINIIIFGFCMLYGSKVHYPAFVLFMGSISYSFYLLHYLICKIFTRLIKMTYLIPMLCVMILICYAITVFCSFIFDRIVNYIISRIQSLAERK